MITADQIVIHAIGDYVLQSDWQANEKTKQHFAAFCHALVYSLGFLVLRPSATALAVIFVTHFFIDRYRLARYVVWAKNWIAAPTYWKLSKGGEWSGSSRRFYTCWRDWIDMGSPAPATVMDDVFTIKKARNLPFSVCSGTGYPPDRPAWLAVWLLIFADNCCHIVINGFALRCL